MSLLEVEIKELRDMHSHLLDGTINSKDCALRLKIYKATVEREKMILDMFKLSTLRGITMGKFAEIGLFSHSAKLPESITKQNEERISCPDMDKDITREECLDFSGSPANTESCLSCANFDETRKILL